MVDPDGGFVEGDHLPLPPIGLHLGELAMRLNHARCACTQVLVLLPIDSGPSHEKSRQGTEQGRFPKKR